MNCFFIYAIGADGKGYLDRDGNPCHDPDMMGEATAISVFNEALKGFSPDVELYLCIDAGRGYPIMLERQCGEADEEDWQ